VGNLKKKKQQVIQWQGYINCAGGRED